MNSEIVSQISNEIESSLSEVFPDLVQIFKHYGISETVEIRLRDLEHSSTLHPGVRCRWVCNNGVCNLECIWNPDGAFTTSSGENTLISNSEKSQQFCADIQSKLPMAAVTQSVQQSEEVPEIYININPNLVNNAHVSCKFVDGVIICSNPLP